MSNKFQKLTRHLPSIYQPMVNRFIRGLFEAWGFAHDDIEAAIASTKDQLFVETSEGEYLDKLGANVGVERFSKIGITDLDYKKLIPALSFAPKQIRDTIWKVLEVFYGTDTIYANYLNTIEEPYNLTDGDTLLITLDNSESIIATFSSSDFADISQATALEVANSINKQIAEQNLRAETFLDNVTNKTYIRLRSLTPGSFGAIQVIGGYAQNALKFPDVRAITHGIGTQWEIAIYSNDIIRMEWTGIGLEPDLNPVNIGDYMIISGPFNIANKGTYNVRNVIINGTVDGITPGLKWTGKYIEFNNASPYPQTVTQTGLLDVTFYYPFKALAIELQLPALMYEVNHKEIVISVPSTSPIVVRTLLGSAHLQPNVDRKVMEISNPANLLFVDGESLTGCDAIYMVTGADNFVPGDIISGGLSGVTATVYQIISNSLNDTILAVKNVSGAFIVGETITGSISGATRNFVRIVSTIGATTTIEATLELNKKYAISMPSKEFTAGEALIGRTVIVTNESIGKWQVGETINTFDAFYLVKPWSNSYTNGETIQGLTSGQTAVVETVVCDKRNAKIVLRVSGVSGAFTVGETVQGLTSLATALFSQHITPSGASAVIESITYNSFDTSILYIQNQVGVFKLGESLSGITSGAEGVFGSINTSTGIFVSVNTVSDFLSSYVYDETINKTVSSISATLAQNINRGTSLQILQCNGLSDDWLDQKGYFIIEYGVSDEEGPILYAAKPNDNTLVINPSYVFKHDHVIGDKIQLITKLDAPTIAIDGSDYPAYITGLQEAVDALQEIVRSLLAAGVVVRFIINYPEYRWECINKVSSLEKEERPVITSLVLPPNESDWFVIGSIALTPDDEVGKGFGSADPAKTAGGKFKKL